MQRLKRFRACLEEVEWTVRVFSVMQHCVILSSPQTRRLSCPVLISCLLVCSLRGKATFIHLSCPFSLFFSCLQPFSAPWFLRPIPCLNSACPHHVSLSYFFLPLMLSGQHIHLAWWMRPRADSHVLVLLRGFSTCCINHTALRSQELWLIMP